MADRSKPHDPPPSTAPAIEVPGNIQAIIEAMPLAVFVCDRNGRIVHANQRAHGLWGEALRPGTPGQLLLDCSQPRASWTAAKRGEAPIAQALRSGQPLHHVELVIETAGGVAMRATGDFVPLREGDGSISGLVCSLQTLQPQDDIEDFFENSAVGLQLVARDGMVLRANQAELDLLGYSAEEYVGHHVSEFHADPEVISDILARLSAGEKLDKQPARLRARDGSIKHVQITSSVRFDDAGFVNTRCFTVDVTEQKRLMEAAEERQRISRELIRALPLAIYTTDAEGRLDFYNDAAVALAGVRPTLGEVWASSWRLFHLDGRPMPYAESPMAVTLAERRAVREVQAICERPDGSRVAFAPYPAPLIDDRGVLTGGFNLLVDITAHKHTEQALQELNASLEQRVAQRTHEAEQALLQLHRSERNLALLVRSVVDYAIYMLDPDGNVTNWNPGAERIKGYRAEEIIGSNFSAFYTPEDRAQGRPQAALRAALRDGRFEAEGWRVRKDGTRFWALVVIDPIIDGGKLIGFAKITRDNTERQSAERALIDSERRARGVIDTALDGFAQLDGDGRVVEWNPRAEAIFGWSRCEALGQPLVDLIAAPTDRDRYRELLPPTRPETSRHGHHTHIEAVSRDGRKLPLELSISTLHLDDGKLFNVFLLDLTEKLLIDAKLRQAQKMDAIGHLTGGIAHDFNNMLQGIIGSHDLIRLRLEQGRTADLARFLEGATASAKRAAGLTHRLLAFSRRQPLDPRPVQIKPLLASMEELLYRTMGEHIRVHFELAPDAWTILCDPNQLESAVLNLAINAREAMPDGGTLTIRSCNTDAGADDAEPGVSHLLEGGQREYVCVEVIDSGSGMSTEVIERAFDPFFTTKPAGQGTGLGLSMVYGFARQSRGHCDIQSEPGKGTRVRLCLPRYADALAQAPTIAETPPVHAEGRGESVLVVEDDEVVRAVVTEVLEQLGYRVTQAIDGLAGLQVLRSDASIDLLVSDIGLPGMNGREMAGAAREHRPRLPVLLMTGYAPSAAVPDGFLGPGMELLTKPFTTATLAARVKAMLPSK